MITRWMIFKDWLRAKFWHKISAATVPGMDEVALVRIRPRLFARIFNYITVNTMVMKRSTNSHGNVVWMVVKGDAAGSYAARQLTTYRLLEKARKLGAIEDEHAPTKEPVKLQIVHSDDPANRIQN